MMEVSVTLVDVDDTVEAADNSIQGIVSSLDFLKAYVAANYS